MAAKPVCVDAEGGTASVAPAAESALVPAIRQLRLLPIYRGRT